jgi:PLP dependent protein
MIDSALCIIVLCMDQILQTNLLQVEKRVKEACQRTSRNPAEIRVLLATKTVSPQRLTNAMALNYKLFGENTLQELVGKQKELTSPEIEWHFIGALQGKKAKEVMKRCSLIHSMDRWSLAEELQKRAVDKPVNILIEINSSGESTKAGVAPEEAVAFAKKLESMDRLHIQGVMTLAVPSEDTQKIRDCFRKTRQCFEDIKALNLKNANMKYLSMGMSNDFELAIEEGSNLIRLGSIAFGERSI